MSPPPSLIYLRVFSFVWGGGHIYNAGAAPGVAEGQLLNPQASEKLMQMDSFKVQPQCLVDIQQSFLNLQG